MSVTDGRLNLAKRPFVDTRSANLAVALLLLTAVGLSIVSARTVYRYFDGSKKTREAITQLRGEIARTEALRQQKEATLARVDIGELSQDAADAEQLARRRKFSWTRFLSRLEVTLPENVRVVSIGLHKGDVGKSAKTGVDPTAWVDLVLVSKDLDGLPKVIRAFYGSPWFDRPAPRSEEGLERGFADGARFLLGVQYLDAGKRRP